MPDAGLVKALRDAGWGFFVLAAIALGAVAIAWRMYGAPSDDVQGYVEAGAIGSTIISAALLFWRATAENRALGRFFMKKRLAARFDKLTPRQRQLIVNVYNTGKRDFDVPLGMSSERYFEELVEWGFVDPVTQYVYWSGQTAYPYKLTKLGWEVIKTKTP